MRLLLVEDDWLLADGISKFLKGSFALDTCDSCAGALAAIGSVDYDTILLDLGLRDGDGLQLLAQLRAQKKMTPVLIITARYALKDKLAGLNLGADDYLAKPFELAELEARVRALLRRRYLTLESEIKVGNLRFDQSGRRFYSDDEALDLSGREVDVLETLMLNMGRVVNKEQLLEKINEADQELGVNAIEVYIHRLRKKIQPVGFHLRTIRGLGYLLETTEKAA